jgi:hypothetical protein
MIENLNTWHAYTQMLVHFLSPEKILRVGMPRQIKQLLQPFEIEIIG